MLNVFLERTLSRNGKHFSALADVKNRRTTNTIQSALQPYRKLKLVAEVWGTMIWIQIHLRHDSDVLPMLDLRQKIEAQSLPVIHVALDFNTC